MKNVSTPTGGSYKVLPLGTFTNFDRSLATDSILAANQPKHKGWIYIIGRILVLIVGLALMAYSFMWATDGLWNIATITFVLGLFFFVPFILFGRKIKKLNKLKRSQSL
jgi:hypothetical protein